MRVDIEGGGEVTPEIPFPVVVNAFNDTDRIDGLELVVELPGQGLGKHRLTVGDASQPPIKHRLTVGDADTPTIDRNESVTPDALTTFPDERSSSAVTVTVPRIVDAGHHDLIVHATESFGKERHTERVPIIVAPITELELTARPQVIRSRRRAKVALSIVNFSNHTVDVPLRVTDQEATLKMRLNGARVETDPHLVSIPPRAVQEVELSIDAGMNWLGTNETRMIEVDGSFDDQVLLRLLTLVHRPLIPQGLLTLAMVLLALVLWALVMLSGLRDAIAGGTDDGRLAAPAAFAPSCAELAPDDAGTEAPAEPGAISGSLAFSSPADVAGITVTAAPKDDLGKVVCATTDDAGNFWLGGLAAGEHIVRAVVPGSVPLPESAVAAPAESEPAAEPTLDELVASFADVAAIASDASARGDLSAAAGFLAPPAAEAEPEPAPAEPSGPSLPDGVTVTGSGADSMVEVMMEVPVMAGFETTDVELKFPALARPLVLDGLPPGALVTLSPSDGGAPIMAVVDENGIAAVDAVALGDYTVSVDSDAAKPAEIALSVGASSDPILPPITLEPITLVSISGQVATTHAPVQDATIRLFLEGDTDRFGAVEPATFVTDATGEFTFPDLPSPAAYRAVVTHPDLPTGTSIISVSEGQDAIGVVLPMGANTFRLLVTMPDVAPTNVMTGTATNGSFTASQQVKTTVPCDGPAGPVAPPCFEITGLPAAGVYTVTVTGDGFEPLLFDDVPYDPLVAFDTVTLTSKPLLMKRADITGSVSVPSAFTTVFGPAGMTARADYTAASGLTVDLIRVDGTSPPTSTSTDPEGRFSFPQQAGGDYVVLVEGQGFDVTQEGFGATANLQLSAPLPTVTTGTIIGGGANIVGIRAEDLAGAHPPTAGLMESSTRFALAGLRPGVYLLTFDLADGTTRRCRMETTTGAATFTFDAAIHYPTSTASCSATRVNLGIAAQVMTQSTTTLPVGLDVADLAVNPGAVFAGVPAPPLTVELLLNGTIVWSGSLASGAAVVPAMPSGTNQYLIRLSGEYSEEVRVGAVQLDTTLPVVFLSPSRLPKVEFSITTETVAPIDVLQLLVTANSGQFAAVPLRRTGERWTAAELPVGGYQLSVITTAGPFSCVIELGAANGVVGLRFEQVVPPTPPTPPVVEGVLPEPVVAPEPLPPTLACTVQ